MIKEGEIRKSTPGSVEESSYEHIDQNSNNLIESFLSDSSDTLNDDLMGLSKQLTQKT